MFCTHCGKQLSSGMNFCPYCGQAVSSSVPALSTQEVKSVPIVSSGSGEYRLILVDRNTCSAEKAEDLIQELLGYSAEDADQFVDLAPIEIADNLSALQARILAQAFTEYGCQMVILDEQGEAVDFSEKATAAVYDDDGNLIAKAAAVIGALTLANRVTSYRRYRKPSLLDRLFQPRYTPRPPKPRKQSWMTPRFAEPAPRPARRSAPVRSHTRPAPAASHRSMSPSKGPSGPHGGRRPR